MSSLHVLELAQQRWGCLYFCQYKNSNKSKEKAAGAQRLQPSSSKTFGIWECL